MRRLTRYIIFEFLSVFLTTLTGISLLMVVVVVLVEAIRQGLLAPLSVLRLLPYAVPDALLYAIPVTTLFAACSIYGRLSASNELTAVKAAGVSPMTMLRPTLILSLILSLVVLWLNDVAVTWGRTGVKRVLLESVEQIVYSMLRSQKSYSTPRFSINVRGIEGQRMIKPTVTLRLDDRGPPTNIMAEEAELRCDAVSETLTIVLRDCEMTMGKFHGDFPGEITRVIPLSDATRRGRERNRPSDTQLNRISQAIRDQNEQIDEWKRTCAAEASLQILTGDFAALTGPEWSSRHDEIQNGTARLHRLRTEPWRRAANGFSCFFFALVAAPLAIRLRTDVWTSFAVCFLGLLPVYYPLMMFGADLAKSGELPPYCVWMGNLVLAAVGTWLIRKTLRY